MKPGFEWDEQKAQQNLEKHGISFEEAATIFGDPFSLTIDAPLHSIDEKRCVTLSYSEAQRLLIVVQNRGDNIRIISARAATRRERKTYEQNF